MADDTSFMDWTPTRSPASFNPYPETYMPGGWPITPPARTIQAFARPAPSGFILPAAKRLCVGIAAIGDFTYKALISTGGAIRQNIAPRRPAYAIIRAFRREQRRQPRALPNSPFRRAATAYDATEHPPIQIAERSSPSTPLALQQRAQLHQNTPNPSEAIPLNLTQPIIEIKNQNNKRPGEPMFRPKRRVRFPSPEVESILESKPRATGPFAKMPAFAPPKESTPQTVKTPVNHSKSTPPACDRLTSPYPDLHPYSAGRPQNPTPPESPSTQLLGELEIAASGESDSDASSIVSESWRPLNRATKSRVEKKAESTTGAKVSPLTPTKVPNVNHPQTPTPIIIVESEESTRNSQAKPEGVQSQLLTPPPIRSRSHLGVSPESDISSSCDFPVIPTPELYSKNATDVGSSTIPIKLTDESDSHVDQATSDDKDQNVAIDEEAYIQTPEHKLQQLAKELTIQDLHTPEGPTPKADRHSSEKKTRLTRAQQKKLEAEKELLKYEIVPLNADWESKVREATRSGHGKLKASDFARVVPPMQGRSTDNWLNDEVINEYLSLIVQHGKQNDRKDQTPTHHAFTSFFYTNLEKRGYESVKRWANRAKIGGKNLLQTEQVFVPINSGMHWTLCVVSGSKKTITHYNSLRGSGKRYIEVIKEWVKAELGTAFEEKEWTLNESGPSPQQQNMDDCGVFTITSARQIMLGFTPMSYKPNQILVQRKRIVAELVNGGLIKSHE